MSDIDGPKGKRVARRTTLIGLTVCALSITAAAVIASPGQAAPEVRITAAGDYAATSDTAAVLGEVARIDADAHLALGDLGYSSVQNPYAWCDFVKQSVGEGFPFQLVSGNHESDDNNDGDINDFSSCLPNQVPGIIGTYGRQYAMDLPPNAPLVRVIQASPNLTFEEGLLTYNTGDANYSWLSDAIDEGRANGAQWIIVTSHYPCLTVGTNGCPAVPDFYDLLVDKGVDLVLHGHEHNYARTHQLASGTAECPRISLRSTNVDCIADDDDVFGAGFGTVFATVGTGGIQLRDVNPADTEAGYFGAWSGANSTPTHGLLDLTMTETELSAQFVDATGGGFTDAFTITQGLPSPTTTTTTPTTTSTTTVPITSTTTIPTATTTVPTSTTSTTSSTTTSIPTATSTVAPSTTTSVPNATTTVPTSTTAAPSTTTTTTTSTSTTTTSTTSTTTTTTTLPPVDPPLAVDTFTRTTINGWGVSDGGAPWSTPSATALSVNNGVGRLAMPSGSARQAYLDAVSSTDTDLELTLSVDKVAGGSGLYVSVIPRSIGANSYRAVLRYESSGRVTVRLDRDFSNIAPAVVVPGVTATPGTVLHTRVQAVGTSPTLVQVKVWEAGTAEPVGWSRSVTDDAAALQQAGRLGVYAYYSSSATNAPITISVDDLIATNS